MKSRITIILLSLVLAIAVISCASKPTPVEEPVQLKTAGPSYTVIEHKNTMFNRDIPFWVPEDTGILEQDSRFEDMYVFKFERTGQDLNGTKTLADNLDASSEIARMVNLRVKQKFAAAEVGDANSVETYFENVVQTLSDTTVSGFRKYGDFWVLRQDNKTGVNEYIYFSLYTIAKNEVNRLIQAAITGESANTEEEQTARQRVQEIFESGL